MATAIIGSPGRIPTRPMRGSAGFTLVELMVTIAILAILLTIAVPSFNQATLGSKLNSMANAFVASAQLARSEAIKRNAVVTLCSSTNGTSCGGTWKDGWVVLAGGAMIHRQGPLTKDFELSGNVSSIDFQPSGMNATCTALTLENTKYDSQKRFVTISGTGRPRVDKTSTESCS